MEKERTLDDYQFELDDFSDRFIRPAIEALSLDDKAQLLELLGMSLDDTD